jgi:hypothetical protein
MLLSSRTIWLRKYFRSPHGRAMRSANMKRYFNKRRQKVLLILGNKCCKCGFSDWRALQVDHINGCGSKNRLNRHRSMKDVVDHPEKYQLLCANCNWIKKYESPNEVGGRKISMV